MGEPKLEAELAPGKRLGAIAFGELLACRRIGEVCAVLSGDGEPAWLGQARRLAAGGAEPRIVRVRDEPAGLSVSLREGLKELLPSRPEAVLVVLADQPFATANLFESLILAFKEQGNSPDYAACSSFGMPHPPALFAPAMYKALANLEGDRGARKLLVSPEYRGVLLEVGGGAVLYDIDTPEQLEEGRRLWREAVRSEGGEEDAAKKNGAAIALRHASARRDGGLDL